MAELEEIIRSHQDAFAGTLAESIMAGWLGGAKSAFASLGDAPAIPGFSPTEPPGKPPAPASADAEEPEGPFSEFPGLEETIQSLLNRKILSPADFYALSAEAKQQAFTISGGLADDTLEKLRQLLVDNLEGPASREAFTKTARETFDTLPISDAHLEAVYRNNANEAYAQGMEHVLDNPMVADAFGFRAYFAIHDSRARPTHKALEYTGLNKTNVYWANDPVWRAIRPPNDFSCRCGFAPLSTRDAARLGVEAAKEWLETGIQPTTDKLCVPWPTFEGQPITFSPSWQRDVMV